jgi:hypothetical protein
MNDLKQMYHDCAVRCRDEGVRIETTKGGAISRWIDRNAKCRPGTEFFIVNGIAAEMADLEAQEEGYRDQLHRAAERAFAKVA